MPLSVKIEMDCHRLRTSIGGERDIGAELLTVAVHAASALQLTMFAEAASQLKQRKARRVFEVGGRLHLYQWVSGKLLHKEVQRVMEAKLH
jgi:hypothetical protein